MGLPQPKWVMTALVLVAGIIYPATALAAGPSNGSLDASFGSGGIATISGNELPFAVTEDAQGRTITAGSTTDDATWRFVVRRFLPSGQPDLGFATGGVYTHAWSGTDNSAYGVAVQDDGKIVVAGYVDSKKTAVFRLSDDGSIDTSFGTGGYAVFSIGVGSNMAYAMMLQPDGKILVGGYDNKVGSGTDMYVARIDGNGALDTTFSGDGVTSIPAAAEQRTLGLALYPDGRILATGHTTGTSRDTALWRFLADGTPDTSFGTGGAVAMTQSTCSDYGTDVTILPDERILMGSITSSCSGFGIGVARFLANGTLDTSFGSSGLALAQLNGLGSYLGAAAMNRQADGKILVAHNTETGGDGQLAFFRVDADGTPDATWGASGVKLIDLGRRYEAVYGMHMRSDGRVVAVGPGSNISVGEPDTIFALRLNLTVDTTAPVASLQGTLDGNAAVFTVQASDAGTGLAPAAYSWDGGSSWGSQASLRVEAVSPESVTTRSVRVRDVEGNEAVATASVDGPPPPPPPPTITRTAEPNQSPMLSTGQVVFAVDDHGAGIQSITAAFRGKEVALRTPTVDVSRLPEGKGTLTIIAINDNGQSSRLDIPITIDRTAPTIRTRDAWHEIGTNARLPVTDNVSGSVRSHAVVRARRIGPNRVRVKLRDRAGNSAWQTVVVQRHISLANSRLNPRGMGSSRATLDSAFQALVHDASWYSRNDLSPIVVREVQWRLQHFGYLDRATRRTGRLDSATIQAVRRYQRARHIPAMGTIGPLTRRSLDRDLSTA